MSAISATTTAYEHVQRDENGAPFLAGTTMKIVELVMAQMAHGWSPEELHFQYPYLSMGQVHSALAFYWEHKSELDDEIQRRLEYVENIRTEAEKKPSLLKARLQEEGYIA